MLVALGVIGVDAGGVDLDRDRLRLRACLGKSNVKLPDTVSKVPIIQETPMCEILN